MDLTPPPGTRTQHPGAPASAAASVARYPGRWAIFAVVLLAD